MRRRMLVSGCGSEQQLYDVVEATISDVHAAYADGTLTAVALTQIYLDRISEYDAAINAFVVLNPNAPDRAA